MRREVGTFPDLCCMCLRGGNVEAKEQRRGESRAIVGRLTTPHDLIVMLKTVGEAGRSVGGRDASHHKLSDQGRGMRPLWKTESFLRFLLVY